MSTFQFFMTVFAVLVAFALRYLILEAWSFILYNSSGQYKKDKISEDWIINNYKNSLKNGSLSEEDFIKRLNTKSSTLRMARKVLGKPEKEIKEMIKAAHKDKG